MRACAVPTQQYSCRSSTRIWKNSCWSLNVSVAVCCCMAATCDGVVVEWRRKRRQRSGERRRRAAAALLLRRASSARRSRLSLLAHDSCCKLSLRLSRRAPLPPCSRCVAAGAVCRAWGAPLTGRSRCVRTWRLGRTAIARACLARLMLQCCRHNDLCPLPSPQHCLSAVCCPLHESVRSCSVMQVHIGVPTGAFVFQQGFVQRGWSISRLADAVQRKARACWRAAGL